MGGPSRTVAKTFAGKRRVVRQRPGTPVMRPYGAHVNGDRAAEHLVRHSRLRVELADYERDDGSPDWVRLTDELAHSGSEVALVRLVRSLADGELREAPGSTSTTTRCCSRPWTHGGDPLRAGRRQM